MQTSAVPTVVGLTRKWWSQVARRWNENPQHLSVALAASRKFDSPLAAESCGFATANSAHESELVTERSIRIDIENTLCLLDFGAGLQHHIPKSGFAVLVQVKCCPLLWSIGAVKTATMREFEPKKKRLRVLNNSSSTSLGVH